MRKITLQLGISLLEVLLSLSLIAIILVAATRYFFVASNANKTNITIRQVAGIVAATKSWQNGGSTSFNDISISNLCSADLLIGLPGLQGSDNQKCTAVNTPWGANYNLSPSTDNNQASITVEVYNSHTCDILKNAFPLSTCSGKTFNYIFS